MRGIHRSPVDSPHKGQWRGALMLSLICALTSGSANKRDAGDLRRHRAHNDFTVMFRYSYTYVCDVNIVHTYIVNRKLSQHVITSLYNSEASLFFFNKSFQTSFPACRPEPDQIPCNDNCGCYYREDICDGTSQCSDSSDEDEEICATDTDTSSDTGNYSSILSRQGFLCYISWNSAMGFFCAILLSLYWW